MDLKHNIQDINQRKQLRKKTIQIAKKPIQAQESKQQQQQQQQPQTTAPQGGAGEQH